MRLWRALMVMVARPFTAFSSEVAGLMNMESVIAWRKPLKIRNNIYSTSLFNKLDRACDIILATK